MDTNEVINETLNDLLKINNDRIAGYERAISETKGLDIDLKALFESMVEQSRRHKEELAQSIVSNGGVVEDETTSAGNIYRAWMDIKSSITDSSRVSILGSCEFGEDAAQRAYDAALAPNVLLDPATRDLVVQQQEALKKSQELIKKQHEAHKQLSE